ncbi:GrlR family regulatory protein [Candidatus Korobacter versatilis]|nr:GrlR family regulatory protein [Candidatus Koribacter versatilis]
MDGLWTAEFGSSVGLSGGGVVVLSNGDVRGGDGGYYYVGTYRRDGNRFVVELRVSPFLLSYNSVFNTIGRPFSLKIEGNLTDESHAIGQGRPLEIPGVTLGVKLTRQA